MVELAPFYTNDIPLTPWAIPEFSRHIGTSMYRDSTVMYAYYQISNSEMAGDLSLSPSLSILMVCCKPIPGSRSII